MRTAELVAGRELDALIAEKVMGWRNWTGADQSGLIGGTWSPSTSIDAAWQIIEKLSCGFQLTYLPLLPEGWTASLFTETGEGIDRTARTAPLAICRAALAAVDH